MLSRKLALFAVLTALCLAIQLLPRLPNVEFTSFFAFSVGLMQGVVIGAFFGGLVMFVNGFLSPWGFAGLNLPFQMLGMAIAGICGGLYGRFTWNVNMSTQFCLETAVLGAFLALVYDLITNVGFGVQLILAGTDPTAALFLAIAYGSFFSITHVLSSGVVFGALFLPLVKMLNTLKVGELTWLQKEHLCS
ncbi:MAG: hypothetical protein ACUVT5_05845 [Candidatus Bathyarchaeales archaeon]